LILLFVLAFAAIVYFAFLLPLRNNPGVKQGMEIVLNDPAVVEMFGAPVRQGLLVTGTIETYTDGDKIGTLSTSISGSKEKGTVGFYLNQPDGGEWEVTSMSIRIGKKIVLTWDLKRASEGIRYYKVP
jgi:hypothetical protein